MYKKIIHASFFSGIGGAELAAQWAGWENAFHCEINPFGRNIIEYYWPKSISYADIKTTDFSLWRGRIDVLSGGFPCQPYSVAGAQKGTDDDRHLWPEMLRGIREIQPRWVVGENVRGFVSWNGGVVFDQVQTDLEAIGYEVLPFLLPACAVNAPHRRDRIWIVAYNKNDKRNGKEPGTTTYATVKSSGGELLKKQTEGQFRGQNFRFASNNNNKGLQRGKETGIAASRWQEQTQQSSRFFCTDWKNFPTQPPVCGGDDGLPAGLDGITFSKWRNESIKGFGNAWVPQEAFQIFKAINEYETNKNKILCHHIRKK